MAVERLSEDDLKALARRIVTNEVYVAWNAEQLENSFGAMLALAGESLREVAPDVGLIYEEYAHASERGCNGYPMFFSMRLLHRDDVETLVAHCKRMDEALNG
jgi:hypothetical protein